MRGLIYNGKQGSFIDGVEISGMVNEGSGIMFTTRGGGIQASYLEGVLKNFKLKNCLITNSPYSGEVVWAGFMEDFEISGNVMNAINSEGKTHTGIFSIYGGNGKLNKNKLTNHQGDMLRLQPSQIASGKRIAIENNIVAFSSMYSAFELKVDSDKQLSAAFKPVDAHIKNNTAVSLSKIRTGDLKREGQILDVYNLAGGKAYFDNNLGVDLFTPSDKGIADMINYNYDKQVVMGGNNKYFSNWQDAVSDLNSFKSKLAGVGATI